MLDMLLCYQMIANAIYAGYFLLLADFFRQAWASFFCLVTATMHGRRRAKFLPGGSLSFRNSGAATARGRNEALGRQLERLENYVLSVR